MKLFFISLCCALTIGARAQTTVSKSYPARPGQQVILKFDYPKVKVSTWDKSEISVVAHVSINDGENDSAFSLDEKETGGAIVINEQIRDLDKLPRRYTVVQGGRKTVFKSKEAYQTSGLGAAERYSEGAEIDVTIEVKVPQFCTADINAVYGIVELTNFNAPITIDATYGGIDATLTPALTGKLQATTHYGQIYSNLNLQLKDHTQRDFFNSITAEPGKGPAYSFTSTYGKIYLRKL